MIEAISILGWLVAAVATLAAVRARRRWAALERLRRLAELRASVPDEADQRRAAIARTRATLARHAARSTCAKAGWATRRRNKAKGEGKCTG
jgi:hypothetical protein